MVPRIVSIFFVMLLAAESRPFYGIGGRRKSDIQKVWSFDGAHPVHYPLLPFPVRQSEMFSDLSSLPIRQSSLQFSDMLNRVRKDKISSSEGLQDFDRKTAQMVDQFGQRVRATVQRYQKAQGQRIQNVGKLMEQFKLDEVKDRLKKTLTDQKGLLKKLHSIGWRGKYIGVPYDTMNDDHKIVKKPGVSIASFSQPNAVLVAPAIQSIPMEHPALPEVTTSVYLHQESEPTATIDDYVLPPEVNETTVISNSIDDAERLTTSKKTIILEEDTWTETVFQTKTNPRIQNEPTTTEIGLSTITIMNEENKSLDIKGYTTATKIIPTYSDTFLTKVTSGTEETSSPASETLTEVPSIVTPTAETASTSTTRNSGITSEIISTLSSINSTEEPVATSDEVSTIIDTVFGLAIDREDRKLTTEIVTTYPSKISTESTSWSTTDSITPVVEVLSGFDYTASPSFADAMETSTGVSSTLLFSTFPNESTTTKVDGEEIEGIITTSTEESETLEAVSITTDPVYDPFMTDGKTIAYSVTTSTSATPPETTFWQPITSETTTRVESTFSSMIPSTEIYSTVTERLTTIDSGEATTAPGEVSTMTALDSSTIDSGSTGATSTILNPAVYEPTFEIDIRHIETGTTYPTTITTQATSIFDEIPSTESSPYSSSPIDAEITTVLDDLTRFEGNYLTSPTTEVETITLTDLKLFSSNPIKSNTVATESSTTLGSGFDHPTIGTESNTETASTLQTTILTEKTTSLEEIPEGIRTIGAETGTEILLPFYHTIPKETTAAFDELFTTTTESSNDNETRETGNSYFGISTIEEKLSAATVHEVDSLTTGEETPETTTTFPVTVSTEQTTTLEFEETEGSITVTDLKLFSSNPIESNTVATESSTTLDSGFDHPTIGTESNTETASTLQTTILTEKTTSLEEIPEGIRKIDGETTTEILLPFYHNIPKETTTAFDELFTTTTESSDDNETRETGNSYFGISTIEEKLSTATVYQVGSLTTAGEETPETTTTFPVTVSTEQTTTLEFEETQGSDDSIRFEDHSGKVETTTFADPSIFSTKSTELVTMETESLTTVDSASESPIVNIENITETAFTSQSPILPEKTTALEDVSSAITDTYSAIPTIGVETTTEILLPFSHTILTQSTTVSDQLSTTITETLIDETIPKVQNEATTTSNQDITTFSDYLPKDVDNYLTSSTTEVETTDVVDSTFYSTNPTESITIGAGNLLPILTEKTTTLEEIPAITDSYFSISTIGEGKTPEILLPFPYSNTVPIESTLTFDELSTTTTESPIDSSIIDEETTEVISTLSIIVPSETTTTSAPQITTLSYILPIFVNNYLTTSTTDIKSTTESVSTLIDKASTLEERSTTDSPLDNTTSDTGTYSQVISSSNEISTTTTESSTSGLVTEEEIFSEIYSIFSSTISTDIVEITTVIPEFENSTIDTESTSGIVSTISPSILTEKTITLEDISATTVLTLENSTIDKETTTVIIPTVTSTSFEDVSEATDIWTNSVTDDGETTTKIVTTFFPTLSTETSVDSVSVYNFQARSETGDLNENLNPVVPEFARAAIEEPDVKTLLNLIPLIIEELRKNNLSTAEVYTLRQVFGNIWPLLEEESDRKPGEAVNHKLAMLLYEAGERLSNTDRPIY